MSVVMYGVPTQPSPYDRLTPDELKQQADMLRASLFTSLPAPATKADLDAAVTRIEAQMLALLGEIKRRDVKWAAEMYRLERAAKRKSRRAKR